MSDKQVWPYSGEHLMLRKQAEIYAQLPAACTVSFVVFDLTKNRAEAAPGGCHPPCAWQAQQSDNSPFSLLFVLLSVAEQEDSS